MPTPHATRSNDASPRGSGRRFVTLVERDDLLTEIMDDPDCDLVRLRRTLERFDLVNRAVASWGSVYRARLRPVLRAAQARGGRARVLDVGCGGGDVLRRIVGWAARDGLAVTGVGVDPDPRAIAVATAADAPAGITYHECRSTDLVREGARFDVVLSNHLLHHLDGAEFDGLLRDSAALTSGLAVHSDIARGRLAYAGFAVGSVPASVGTLIRVDGLRSIRRSYTWAELQARLPGGWSAERVGPFRVLAVRRGDGHAGSRP